MTDWLRISAQEKYSDEQGGGEWCGDHKLGKNGLTYFK